MELFEFYFISISPSNYKSPPCLLPRAFSIQFWMVHDPRGCWTKMYFPTLVEVNIFVPSFMIKYFLDFRVISKIAFHFCQHIFWSIVSYSTETGHLSCSFSHGLCGWIQHREGDLHWETTADPSGIMVFFYKSLLGQWQIRISQIKKRKNN